MSNICSICQRPHDELPHVSSDRPAQYWDVAEEERDRRIKLTSDTCEIDSKHFFVRGVIEIPVANYTYEFGFGVWVSHKEENYKIYLEHPDSPDIGPFFGWLCTKINYFKDDTELLKTTTYYRGGGLRPMVKLNECDHPLFVYQKKGISLDEAWKIVHFYATQNRVR